MADKYWVPAEIMQSVGGHGELADRRQLADEAESDSDEEPVEPELATDKRRYPLRQRRAPCHLPNREHVLLTKEREPESFKEAMTYTYNKEWYNAMQDEMESFDENHTYELIELTKWVYKLKPG